MRYCLIGAYCICLWSFISGETVSGTVTDSATGLPLKAVAVTSTLDSITVYTDSTGYFSMDMTTGMIPHGTLPRITGMQDGTELYDLQGRCVRSGHPVTDGMYMTVSLQDGKRYLSPVVRAGSVLHTGPVRHSAVKTAGTASLVFGRSGFREQELQTETGNGPLAVSMSPLPDSAYPLVPSEVGPTDPTILDSVGTITVTQSNQVIENVDIHGIIHIKDSVDNIVIRNFRITSSGYWGIFIRNIASTNIVIENGEIDGLDGLDDGINGRNFIMRRVYVHNMGGDSFKASGGNVIEQCYIDKIGQADGAHGDGVQMMGAGDIIIRHNNFQLVTGAINAVIFPGGGGFIPGVVVKANRMNGGAFTVRCNEEMRVLDNVFGRDYGYGIRTSPYLEWTGNVWEDTGEACP